MKLMEFKAIIDQHSHSKFSPDSQSELDALCAKAMQNGYQAYAITDHCECDLYEADGYHNTLLQAFDAIEAQKQRFPALQLLNGVELGQPLQNLTAAEIVAARPYDVILGSLHRIAGMVDFYYFDYHHYSDQEIVSLLEKYYTELYQTVQWGKFDVVAHLTYPLRYIAGDAKRAVDMRAFDDQLESIFRLMAQEGKALEINTSGLAKSIGTCLPDYPLIKRFYDCGGELISMGSDAHTVDNLGAGIHDGIALAHQTGFRSLCYFKDRKAHLLPIE